MFLFLFLAIVFRGTWPSLPCKSSTFMGHCPWYSSVCRFTSLLGTEVRKWKWIYQHSYGGYISQLCWLKQYMNNICLYSFVSSSAAPTLRILSGGFLKWGYPELSSMSDHFSKFFHLEQTILGYPYDYENPHIINHD